MHPSERIKHIKEIARELSKEEWSLLDLTLKRKRLIYDVFKNTHLAANLSLVINAGDKTNDSTSKTLCQTISRTMAAHY